MIGFKYRDGINHSAMDAYMCNATQRKGLDMNFLFNVLMWVGVVIFVIFIVGFMAAAKMNKRQDSARDKK